MLGLMAALAVAATPIPAPPTPLASVRQYRDLILAPKGDVLAVVEADESLDSQADAHGVVVVRDRADGTVLSTYDPCKACVYDSPMWSPDGSALVFVASDRRTLTATLQVVRNGRVQTLLAFDGLLANPRWSPDGRTLAVLATEHPRKLTGATQAGAPIVGEIGAATDEQRVAVLSANGGPLHMLSPPDTFIYEYDWTPDSRGFVVSEAKGDGDNNWWVAKLAAVGLDTAFREIAAPPVQIKTPRVSPDGKTVAFIGGLASDFGPVGGDLWTAPFAGGAATDRTPGFKGSFSSLIWRPGALYATALMGADSNLLTIDPTSGETRVLFGGPGAFNAGDARLSLDRDGKWMAGVAETFTVAPHIAAGPLGKPRQISHENDAAPPRVTARSIVWTNGGFDIQGWLIGPSQVDGAAAAPGRTYPMIVQIHGGPSAASQPTYQWKGSTYELVSHGYYVFQPNPRGSFGQGEAFTRANLKDFGGGDLSDILAGVDAVEKVAPIDDARLGVYGHSYGGFMTMWTVTHSQRFKAAVAGAGIANWVSYYGQNGIDQWMVPFFGSTVYDDATVYDRLSPIRYIKQARTPTFLYVGERDVECPPAQSLEFHHGLQAVGVTDSLMIYPGEGHGIREADHKADLASRTLAWFDTYLGQP